MSHCRLKVKGSTSGAKLTEAVKSIGRKMKFAPQGTSVPAPASLGQQLLSRARTLQRRKSEEEKVPSSNKKAKPDSDRDLMDLYGLTALPAAVVGKGGLQIVLSSDSEEDDVATSGATGSASVSAKAFPPGLQAKASREATGLVSQFVDHSSCKLVRLMQDGTRVVADMKAGPAGFLVGVFAGESVAISTEIPNLMLSPPAPKEAVMKRPAGCVRRPAKAAAKKPAIEAVEPAAEDDEEEGEEEREEEEPLEDPGEPEERQVEVVQRRGSADPQSEPETVDYGESPMFFGACLKIIKSDKSGQSYIVGGKPQDLKKDYKLVVAVSMNAAGKLGLDHKQVAQSLFDKLCLKSQFRKNYAINLRAKC